MPFSLIPRRVFDRYGDITVEYLKEQNITLLLSDLDFTLAAKSTRRPDQPLRDWIAGLSAAGIAFMIVSNNRSGTRGTEFCADLGGADPYSHAGRQTADGYAGGKPGRRAGADGRTSGRSRDGVAEGPPRTSGPFQSGEPDKEPKTSNLNHPPPTATD